MRRLAIVVVVAAGAGASAAAAQSTSTTRGQPSQLINFDSTKALRPPDVPADVRSWPTLLIPEFQDAQRFDSAGKYGAFVRAFAAPNIFVTQYPIGQWFPAGVILVDTWTKVVDANYTVGGASFAGTTIPPNIQSLPPWDVYTNLGLVAGWNCVYMKRTIPPAPGRRGGGARGSGRGGGGGRRGGPVILAGDPGGIAPVWTAIIAGPSPGSGCLVGTNLTPPAGKTLSVTPISTANPSDVIAAARIIEMPGSKRAFGFRCAEEWCVFGAPSSGMPAPIHKNAAGAQTNAKWTLPLWFDEQRLSTAITPGPTVTVHPKGAGLKPILTRASIIPDTGLARYTTDADYAVRDVPVATVYFSEPPEGHYKTAWRFKMGFNQIFLRVDSTGKWNAYVNGEVPGHKLKVKRMDHHDFFNAWGFFPATARWAWVDFDDAVWISCDVGCCYIDPI